MHRNTHSIATRYLRSVVLIAVFLWSIDASIAVANASAWSPTLLVNTEAFQTIDEGDSLTDVEIRFGDTLNEKIYWNRGPARFEFTDDLHAQGNITSSGGIIVTSDSKFKADLTINSDQGAADTILTFGSDGTNETLKFLNNEDRFEFSDDLNVTGGLYASGALIVGGAGSIKGDFTINSDSGAADTVLTFGSDTANETVKFLNNEDRFEFSDDLNATGNITSSGGIIVTSDSKFKADLTINSDNGAADAVLTFGNDTAAETAKFLRVESRFEFSDDVRVTNDLTASGTLSIEGAATFGSTVKLNGVTYTFPTSDGTASGKVLKTNSAGQLSWSSDIDTTGTTATRNSGSMIFLNPEFPHAVYFGSGAATASVGTLGLRYDSGSTVNFYRWQSTKTTSQQYWIITRVRIPDQFSGWQNTKPIEFRYRSSGGWLEVRALDTANAPITLTGHTKLSNSAWTTATITGPEVSGAFASGSYITLMVKMVSSGAAVANRAYADVGFMNLNIETKN